MNKPELLGLVSGLVQDAEGYEQDVTSKQREDALNYYFMRPRGDEVPGESQVVSGDVSAIVEANLAQMMAAFTGDNIVEFEPDGPEDEDQCQLESDAVTHFVMDANNGYLMLLQGIKDALLLRNGIGKVYPDVKTISREREYRGVTPEGYAGMLADPNKLLKVKSWKADEGYLRVRETVRQQKLDIRAVPVENFIHTRDWDQLDVQEIPLAGERHIDIRSKLVERFPEQKTEIAQLPAFINTTQASAARNPRGGNVRQPQTSDPSLDEIEWFETYVLVDKDGDGVAERRRISLVVDKLILEDEEAPFVCYSVGSVLVNPHRLRGISMYDKLKQTQDINTGLKRARNDNANVCNKSRTAYLDGKVNVDDLSNGAVNGNIRIGGDIQDVRQAIMAFMNPDISAGILANIEAEKRDRAELGGAALDLATAQAQLTSSTGSQGVDRAYSVMEQLAALMTRTIAESLIRGIYLLAHATLRIYFDQPMHIKRNGNWQAITPSQWPERSRVNVKLGMSPGERRRKVEALGSILQTQLTLDERGASDVLVNMGNFYSALMDWARAAEIPNPEQYFIDPATDASIEAKDRKDKAAQMQQEGQKRLADMAIALEQMRVTLDSKYNPEQERNLKWQVEQLKAQIEEMKVVGKATADMVKDRADRADTLEAAQSLERAAKSIGNGKTDEAGTAD